MEGNDVLVLGGNDSTSTRERSILILIRESSAAGCPGQRTPRCRSRALWRSSRDECRVLDRLQDCSGSEDRSRWPLAGAEQQTCASLLRGCAIHGQTSGALEAALTNGDTHRPGAPTSSAGPETSDDLEQGLRARVPIPRMRGGAASLDRRSWPARGVADRDATMTSPDWRLPLGATSGTRTPSVSWAADQECRGRGR